MRVLHVIPSMSLVHGGPSRAIRLIERALIERGIAVETATTDDDGPGRRMTSAAGGVHSASTDAAEAVPLASVRHHFSKRLEFYKVSPGFAWWVFRHVRDYDVVHIHALFSFTSVMAAWVARRSGVPYVVRPLGTLNRYGVERRRPWLKQLSLKLVEGPILRRAAAVHFTAGAEQAEALSLGIPMRGIVIPLGIEPPRAEDASALPTRPPNFENGRSMLFLSRLDPKKNVEGLLRAFGLLANEWPGTRLLIAGDGEAGYVVGLKNLADRLGLADRVAWLGHVDGERKAAAFAAAQVFVLPSFSENFGIAAAEALMAGLPCVLGNGVAIAAEVAEAGAGLATSPEPEAIAQALRSVLADEDRRIEMGRRAAALARERYSLDAMGERLVRLYEGIVSCER